MGSPGRGGCGGRRPRSRSTAGAFVSLSQSPAPRLVSSRRTRQLSADPRGAPRCGGDGGSMPCPALGRPAASPGRPHRAGPARPREAGLRARRPPYPRRPLRAPPPPLHLPHRPQRRSPGSGGRGTIAPPPPRPAGPAPRLPLASLPPSSAAAARRRAGRPGDEFCAGNRRRAVAAALGWRRLHVLPAASGDSWRTPAER